MTVGAPHQQTMKEWKVMNKSDYNESSQPNGCTCCNETGCEESCCSILCCCCCRPAIQADHFVSECSGVCCVKWTTFLPHIGFACCATGCARCCCPCGPCKPHVPYEEWTCAFHTMLSGLRTLVARAPMENVYAVQMLTDFPLPWCSYPCGISRQSIRAEVGNQKINGEWMVPDAIENGKVILYFHGGAFVFVNAAAERFHTGQLAKYFGCKVLSMNYPRPPQSPYPAPVDNGLAAWDWLKEQGTKPEDIIISGDSAGGNLAISLVRKLKSRNTNEMPGGLILFSPWVQMIPFPSKSWTSNKNLDYIAIKPVLHMVVDLYIDQAHPDDQDVSPVRADVSEFEGFPPTWIGVGGAEVLRESIEEFHSKLQQANVKTEMFLGKGMPHVWQLLALSTPPPEAKFLPCCLRSCGCGLCCTTGEPKHPTWKSLEDAKVFLKDLGGN